MKGSPAVIEAMNCVLDNHPVAINRYALRSGLVLILSALSLAGGAVAQPGANPDLVRIAALESELDALDAQIRRLEDSKAIKRLQRAYGYYVDKKLADEVAALFAEDATVEIGGLGVYVGRERVARFYGWLMNGPLEDGELYNHMILQGVVDVADDGRTAQGRWRGLIQTGQIGETAIWAEDGVWRFSKVHWYQTVAAPYDPGWHLEALPLSQPSEAFPPDRPPTEIYGSFPDSYLTPFHYDNPVSGRKLMEAR
jgi:hypothetical protein